MAGGTLPRSADVAIIGAGIWGQSIAWHIARRARLKIVVVDRGQPGGQATAKAAALVVRTRLKPCLIPLIDRTCEAIDELGDVIGLPPTFHADGTLQIAASPRSEAELDALVAVAERQGRRVRRLRPRDAASLVPWLAPEPITAAALFADDGSVDAWQLAESYGAAARRCGAAILGGIAVGAIRVAAGRVQGIDTAAGRLDAPIVIVAAGAWSNCLTVPLGFGAPAAPVRSQYWITEAEPALFPRRHPATVIPDARAYTRAEVGALLFGLREAQGVSVDARTLPGDTDGYAFAGDPDGWRSLEAGFEPLAAFLPALRHIGIRRYVTGFSTYTPDGLLALGTVPAIDGLLIATGCCGAGIAGSGGVGALIAALALGESPPFDGSAFRIDRLGAVDPFDAAFLRRCAEARAGKTSG